jgi:hypothetical protein
VDDVRVVRASQVLGKVQGDPPGGVHNELNLKTTMQR